MGAADAARARLARGEARMASQRLQSPSRSDGPSTPPMPPSSLCQPSVRRLSPTERGFEDAARIKARLERLQGAYVPGPGTYDPRRLGRSSENFAGSMAFKSHTDRAKPSHSSAFVVSADPGEYEIAEHGSVHTQAKHTFQTSSK
eukprot:CAMPEP_0174711548 /NCGR_PEP_ID=MMETSP1094-20130205/12834_1 /TAXON_ID=156173 /ORGANISM="Chrysochromulina brevifilum, Strain UTEX LB 985" /LENGTH=144 /DNA_ID=CAMNT_0015910497 /DNA_START=10 /DNA_END=441 /DNA_ORIENTATION=+